MRKTGLLALLLIFISSCSNEELFSDIPSIKLINTSPLEVIELQEAIFFELEYTDGNGDLGENNPDAKNLILLDPRINVKYEYRIQELVPGNTNVPIKGMLTFNIPNAYITDGSNQQSVNYQIYVVDRAGNKSNTETTQTITIKK